MRPRWHGDIKWVAAILAVICLLAASLLYDAFRLTTHDVATGAFTAVVAGFMDDKDSEDYLRVQEEAQANPEAEVQMPGVDLTVKGSEIADLSQAEATRLVIGRVANILYYEGPQAVEDLFPQEDPKTPAGGEGEAAPSGARFDLGPAAVLTEEGHSLIKAVLMGFAGAAAFLLLPLVYFSHRAGRLGSPGMVLLIASLPFALLWQIANRTGPADDGGAGIDAELREVLSPTASGLATLHLSTALLGLSLVVAAVVLHLVLFALEKRRTAQATLAGAAPAPLIEANGEPISQPVDWPGGEADPGGQEEQEQPPVRPNALSPEAEPSHRSEQEEPAPGTSQPEPPSPDRWEEDTRREGGRHPVKSP